MQQYVENCDGKINTLIIPITGCQRSSSENKKHKKSAERSARAKQRRIEKHGIEWERERARQSARKSYIPASQLSAYQREKRNKKHREAKQAKRQKLRELAGVEVGLFMLPFLFKYLIKY